VAAVIQQVMESTSLEVTKQECSFQVTTRLVTKITTLAWHSLNLDSLANGLTPFLLAPYVPNKQAEQQ